MKKKIMVIFISVVFVFGTYNMLNKTLSYKNKRITVNGVENFQPIPSNKENYILYYPSDIRTAQENTIIKEVTKSGNLVREYEIKDNDFQRMSLHQKPNDLNRLYISLFGEPTIDNYYYTYDINNNKFEKIILEYFDYEVGVDHIMHYGEDTIFQTLVSHKTGEQNYEPNTQNFNVSISNYSLKKSFETEYGNAPKWTPFLKFNNKIIYGTAGKVKKNGQYENSGLGIIDLDNQSVEYKSPDKNTDLTPIYSTDKYAFVLDDFGKIYVYDEEFQYKTYEPFNNMFKDDIFYLEDSPPLFLDMNTALYGIYSDTKGFILGLMTFEDKPEFKPLKKNYIEPGSNYRILYQDINEEEIYLIKVSDKKESILVIDNEKFNLIYEIPVDKSHLIDFVVKN